MSKRTEGTPATALAAPPEPTPVVVAPAAAADVDAGDWQPPQAQYERERVARTLARASRDSVSVDQAEAMLASVGIRTEADMDAAQRWNQAYVEGLTIFGTLMHALNFVTWRFSLLGLFWLAVGLFAIFAGTSEFGFLALVIGVLVVAYSLYLFAGGRTRFFII